MGVPLHLEDLYCEVVGEPVRTAPALATALDLDLDHVEEGLASLAELGVLELRGGVAHPVDPVAVLAAQFAREVSGFQQFSRRLGHLAKAGPDSVGIPDDASKLAGAPLTGRTVPEVLIEWIQESDGDLMFMRPDQYQLPSESAMALAVTEAVRQGRRVRGLYPLHALTEAERPLVARAAIGEEIRMVPHLPTRLAVIGANRAMLPDPPGSDRGRRLQLFEEGVVGICTLYFEAVWEHATPFHEAVDRRGSDERVVLLQLMSAGLADDQLARSLGVSLRTVRRRVAALLAELHATSRFQAGVEAARRGWL